MNAVEEFFDAFPYLALILVLPLIPIMLVAEPILWMARRAYTACTTTLREPK